MKEMGQEADFLAPTSSFSKMPLLSQDAHCSHDVELGIVYKFTSPVTFFRCFKRGLTICAKWPPNAEGAKRPKNKADKSSLLVNEFK